MAFSRFDMKCNLSLASSKYNTSSFIVLSEAIDLITLALSISGVASALVSEFLIVIAAFIGAPCNAPSLLTQSRFIE